MADKLVRKNMTLTHRVFRMDGLDCEFQVYDINKGDPPTFVIEGKTSMTDGLFLGTVRNMLVTVIEDSATVGTITRFEWELRNKMIETGIMKEEDILHRILYDEFENRRLYSVRNLIDEKSPMFTSEDDEVTIDDLKDRKQYKCRITITIPHFTYTDGSGRFYPNITLNSAEFLEQPAKQINNQSGESKIPPHFQALFNKLPEEDKRCPICMEQMTEDLAMTPCFHFFHGKCLERCKRMKSECPNCRGRL